jgi:DNA repair photolyase
MSKDIGQYNTCLHECMYCYANTSKEIARINYKTHIVNKILDTITGI